MLLDFLYNGPASTLLWGQGFLSMAAWVPGAQVCAGPGHTWLAASGLCGRGADGGSWYRRIVPLHRPSGR